MATRKLYELSAPLTATCEFCQKSFTFNHFVFQYDYTDGMERQLKNSVNAACCPFCCKLPSVSLAFRRLILIAIWSIFLIFLLLIGLIQYAGDGQETRIPSFLAAYATLAIGWVTLAAIRYDANLPVLVSERQRRYANSNATIPDVHMPNLDGTFRGKIMGLITLFQLTAIYLFAICIAGHDGIFGKNGQLIRWLGIPVMLMMIAGIAWLYWRFTYERKMPAGG